MVTKLRVGRTHAYQLYREVEPVPPASRIDPQQPRDEDPQPQREQRARPENHVQRRFMSMRRLIDELKVLAVVARVDYTIAGQEMTTLAVSSLEEHFPVLLSGLGATQEGIEGVFGQLRPRLTSAVLKSGKTLVEEVNFLPVFVPGLMAYGLFLPDLHVQMNQRQKEIVRTIRADGRFVTEQGRFRLEFRPDHSSPDADEVLLDIFVLTGVNEVDDAGRKAILYQRQNQSFALYADKQIDLSI